MRSWLVAVMVLAIAGGGLAAWMIVRRSGDREPECPKRTLEVTRLQPRPDAGEEIQCDPFARVDFVYLARNNGTEPIRGLKLGLGCQCEAAEQPPEEIAPGATARVGFRLRAADAGTTRRRVELVTQEPHAVLLSLEVALRVKFEPPALARRVERTRLTFIDGDTATRELAFESVEKRETEPWITRLEIEPKALLEVAALPVAEAPHEDPNFSRRIYSFGLSRGRLGVGRHAGWFMLHTRCHPPAMRSPFPLEVEVLDRVAIIPNPVSIALNAGGKCEGARILVVRRAGEGLIEAAQWDRELLELRRAEERGDRSAAFAILPKVLPERPVETTIVFAVGPRETREVKVRILPAGASSTPL